MTEVLREALDARTRLTVDLAALLVRTLRLALQPGDLDPDGPLFGTGLRLDSIDSVELVVAIEEAYGIELLERKGGDPSVLRTLNALADRVASLRSGP